MRVCIPTSTCALLRRLGRQDRQTACLGCERTSRDTDNYLAGPLSLISFQDISLAIPQVVSQEPPALTRRYDAKYWMIELMSSPTHLPTPWLSAQPIYRPLFMAHFSGSALAKRATNMALFLYFTMLYLHLYMEWDHMVFRDALSHTVPSSVNRPYRHE